MIRYVDPSGNLGERTLNGGVSSLVSGDTLIVRAGAYFERLNANTIPSGCTIKAYAGESPMMYGNLWLTQKDSIVWDGIAINGINNGVPTGPGNGETFNNVYLNGCINISILNSEIFNASKLNVLVHDGNGPTGNIFFKNCNVHDAGKGGWFDPSVEPANHNFYISAHFTKTGLISIEGCEIYNALVGPNAWGVQIYSTDKGFLDGVVVANCYIHDNKQGLVVGSGSNHKILNNILYNNSLAGSYGEAAITVGYGDFENVLVANNTIVGNRGSAGISTGPWGYPRNTRIANNILWANGIDSVDQASGSGTVMEGNLMGVDPRFLSGSQLFQLGPDSPAIGIGVNLSSIFSTDITGALRPSSGPWSAGAYEVISTGETPQTKTCWDGSVIPIDQNCPPQTKTCWDGSVIPIDQNCPAPPSTGGGKGGHRRPRPKPRG